ncbi:MAG: hypothetical protein IJP31_04585 [Lachnospiraceae bacterium]|nr:hypothetical protein [Lachnospiraceae bacterium]
MLFLDISADDTPEWARIGKSTVYDLVLNAQTEENNFIEDEMPSTDITYYKPEISQELQANKGDPAFDFIYGMFYLLPTGEDVKLPALFVFAGNVGTENDPMFNAWNTVSTITLDHFDSVAEKIYFKLNINSIERGTVKVAGGKPTYTKTATT